jgi:hypothetical protein
VIVIVDHGMDNIGFLLNLLKKTGGGAPGALAQTPSPGSVYQFLIPRPDVAEQATGLDRVAASRGILDSEVLVSHGDILRPVRVGGDRAGIVIVGDETREAAMERANRFVVADAGG